MNNFAKAGNGSKAFYFEMEEHIIDSPIHFDIKSASQLIKAYSTID